MSVDYLPYDLPVREHLLDWQKRGLQQTASGYGSKLTTSKEVFYNNRWYRVYAIHYSNAGSAYIISKGKRLFLQGE